MHLAAEQRLVDAVQVLIKKGADINVKDSVEVVNESVLLTLVLSLWYLHYCG